MSIVINISNHINSCRICLKHFDIDDVQIKITPKVEENYEKLTQFELKRPNEYLYSNTICELCNNKLRTFSSFRDESIDKQKLLIEFVEPEEKIKEEIQENFEEVLNEDEFFTTEYLEDVVEMQEEYQDPELEKKKPETEPKKYKKAMCKICKKFYYKDHLQRHIDKVHYKVKRYFCDICGHGSFLKCNLSTHMFTHVAKEFREQICCELCNSTFTRIESLKNHMKTDHETPIMLQCFCGKEFNLKHKLNTHIKRTHNNVRDHGCDQCPKRFFTPKELKVHVQKSHTPGYVNTTTFFCEICGKSYSSSKSLRTHMKYHQEPEFRCSFDNCNKGFITKILLVQHEKIHLGQRDHMCHLCEKSFFSANHLRRHILVSHDKIRINCFVEGCRFSVGRKDYLRNHILSHRELSDDVKNSFLTKIRDTKI